MKKIQLSKIALAMTMGVTILVSCSKSDDTPAPAAGLPPIGGYASADAIAPADLLAYWPLNGDGKESKSSALPSTSIGATYEIGVKGQGVKLTNGYMKYPSIASLPTSLTAYTISSWAKIKNNSMPPNGSVSVFLSLARPNEWEGNLNLYAETGQRPAIEANGAVNDSIVVKSGFRTVASGGQAYENLLHLETWMKSDNIANPGKHVAYPIATGSTWAHYLATWDGTTNKFIIYINGVKASNPAFETRGSNTSIVFDTPITPFIGAFGTVATTTDIWNKPMTGNLDEIRLWKKALTQPEITALYQLEKVGR